MNCDLFCKGKISLIFDEILTVLLAEFQLFHIKLVIRLYVIDSGDHAVSSRVFQFI